jgi:putative sterol carrier protein
MATKYKNAEEMGQVLTRMADLMSRDPELIEVSKRSKLTVAYEFPDVGVVFYTRFGDGGPAAGLGAVDDAEIKLRMNSDVFDGLFTGTMNPVAAYEFGRLSFTGSMNTAMRLQELIPDFGRAYSQAKADYFGANHAS